MQVVRLIVPRISVYVVAMPSNYNPPGLLTYLAQPMPRHIRSPAFQIRSIIPALDSAPAPLLRLPPMRLAVLLPILNKLRALRLLARTLRPRLSASLAIHLPRLD